MKDTFELLSPLPALTDLDAAGLDALRALADAMIPALDGRPSGSAVLIDAGTLDRARAARPDLDAPLHAALAAVDRDLLRSEPALALDDLADREPTVFQAVGQLLAGAYVIHQDVRTAIGYPGQEALPLRDDTEEYFEMLAEVVERGPFLREVPKD